MFENGLYNITVKDATSTGLFLGQQKSTSDKSQELLPPILESLSRSVLTRVTLCGEGCKVANRDEDCGHVTSSPPITAHLEGVQIDVVQQEGHSPGLCRRSKLVLFHNQLYNHGEGPY